MQLLMLLILQMLGKQYLRDWIQEGRCTVRLSADFMMRWHWHSGNCHL